MGDTDKRRPEDGQRRPASFPCHCWSWWNARRRFG